MDKRQYAWNLPEPSPFIEVVKFRNEDGTNYRVEHVRAAFIEDQNFANFRDFAPAFHAEFDEAQFGRYDDPTNA